MWWAGAGEELRAVTTGRPASIASGAIGRFRHGDHGGADLPR